MAAVGVYSDLYQESTAFYMLSTISRQLLQPGRFWMALRLGRQADRLLTQRHTPVERSVGGV